MPEGRIEVLLVIEYYRVVHSNIKNLWVINIRHDNCELYEGGGRRILLDFIAHVLPYIFFSDEISTMSFHISL